MEMLRTQPTPSKKPLMVGSPGNTGQRGGKKPQTAMNRPFSRPVGE